MLAILVMQHIRLLVVSALADLRAPLGLVWGLFGLLLSLLEFSKVYLEFSCVCRFFRSSVWHLSFVCFVAASFVPERQWDFTLPRGGSS